MSRPKGSKNKKPVQLSLETIGVPEHNALEYPGTTKLMTPNEIRKLEFIEDEVISNMEITHALRTINQGNFAEIEQSFKEKFFDQGWKLFATHYIGQISEGIMILYILIREQ